MATRHAPVEAGARVRHAATGACPRQGVTGALRRLSRVLVALVALGCAEEPALDEYELSIRIESDPGRPLAGATLLGAGEFQTVSDASGLVRMRVLGEQGQAVRFQIRCPYGHRSPEQPLELTLTRLGAGAPPPEYRVRCAPELRSVVIAVRAQNGPGLPVTYLGREVARTDRSGAAHVLMQLPPTEPLELSLDTSSEPRLKPKNPSLRIAPPDTDAVLLFDEEFVVDAPPPKLGPSRPQRIKSRRGAR
jgi:hypothetical protein